MPRPDLSQDSRPDPTPNKAAEKKAVRTVPAKPKPERPPLPPYTFHWIFISVVTFVYLLALLFFPPLFTPEAHKGSDAMLFIGRFHPILLHLPVGALIILLLLETGCLRQNIEAQWGSAALFISLVNAASSVVAVIAGLLLSREGFEGGAYKLHTFFGVIIGFGALIAAYCRLSAMTVGEAKGLMEANRFILLMTLVAMSVGAHFGANMVHGPKYLTEYAPKPIAASMQGFEKFMLNFVTEKKQPITKPAPPLVAPVKPAPPVKVETPEKVSMLPVGNTMSQIAANQPVQIPKIGLPPPVQPEPAATTETMPSASVPPGGDKLVFKHVILPILEAKCNSCHNEQKTKGKLRMDTFELLMQGGQDTVKTIIPGNVAGSLAIIRIDLPTDEDEHMPPENKEQLTPEELTLLKSWIAAGATSTQTLKEAKLPPETLATVETLLKK